jgi:hypothetical protein
VADVETASGFRTMPATPARTAPVGMPRLVAYEYRARTYPWALAVLKAAEAVHGTPPHDLVADPRRVEKPRCGGCGYAVARCDCAARQR